MQYDFAEETTGMPFRPNAELSLQDTRRLGTAASQERTTSGILPAIPDTSGRSGSPRIGIAASRGRSAFREWPPVHAGPVREVRRSGQATASLRRTAPTERTAQVGRDRPAIPLPNRGDDSAVVDRRRPYAPISYHGRLLLDVDPSRFQNRHNRPGQSREFPDSEKSPQADPVRIDPAIIRS